MLARIRRQLTYANVVSTICLFVVLGGSSYAAVKISGKDVKPDTLTGVHIKDGSLQRKDFKKNLLPTSPQGKAGATGAAGAPGAPGAPGEAGPQGPAGGVHSPATPTPIAQRATLTRSGSEPISFTVLSSRFSGIHPGSVGAGTGKVQFGDLVLVKRPDAASDDLATAAAKSTFFSAAKLELLNSDGSPGVTLDLDETLVAGFAVSDMGGGREETLTLKVAPGTSTAAPPKLTIAAGTSFPAGGPPAGTITIAAISGSAPVLSESWGIENDGTLGAGGSASGETSVDDLTVTKPIALSSAALLNALKAGTLFATATVTMVAPDGSGAGRYALEEVEVRGYELVVDTVAQETVVLGYDKVERVLPVAGGEQKTCWEVSAAESC